MLKLVLFLVVAIAVLVACIVAFIFVQQALQALSFRRSMRSFAKDDAEERDPALEVPENKGTLEEEQARQLALWELFYRRGLSIAKLHAARRLRESGAFIRPEWIFWEEWRGWYRLAIKGSEAVRKRAREHARADAGRKLNGLSPRLLPLWLSLYDDKEHPALQLRWAQYNLTDGAKRAALRLLEELATRNDATGAHALYDLFEYYRNNGTPTQVLEYAKRCLSRSNTSFHDGVRRGLRQTFYPELERPVQVGTHWAISASRGVKLAVRVHALDVKASETAWLDSPQAPLSAAAIGDLLWESPIEDRTWPLWIKPTHFFKLPHLEGPIQVEVSAQYPAPALWSDCMGDEEMPIVNQSHRVLNTSLDAVLSLTETSVSTWVVDKKTKAPVANAAVTLMHRDAHGGNLETYSSVTDEQGLFTWKGYGAWQFGVLIERTNSQGRKEQLFLTNANDVTTSKAPQPQRRFYIMLARPLYRPGERVQGKLFARLKAHEGNSKKLAAEQTYQLEVVDPRGNKLTKISCTLSAFGSAAFDFVIPADATLGRYSFQLAGNAGASIEGALYIEEFVAPEFRAELRAKDKPSWGKKYELEFEAHYFFGAPVAHAEGTLEVKRSNWSYRKFDHVPFVKRFSPPKQLRSIPFKTDAQGKAIIDISWNGPLNLFRSLDGSDFDFEAIVRDASGKSCQATLHVSIPRTDVIVSVKPARSLRLPGETLPLRLQWQPADPADTTARKLTIVCRKGFTTKTMVQEARRADEEFSLPLDLPAGKWELSAFVEGQPRRARTTHSFTLLGPDLHQKQRELLVSNDPSDSQGTIRVAVTGPRTYCAKELLVYNRGPRLGSKVISRSSSTTWVDLPFIGGTEERVFLSLWYFDSKNEPLHQAQATVEIKPPEMQRDVPVSLSLAFPQASIRPGAETSLEAKLGAAEQKPSELTVTVVDEALFSLVPPPKSAVAFFEDSPPRPQSFPAWSTVSAYAQTGRRVSAPVSYSMQGLPYQPMGEALDLPMQSMPVSSMAMMRSMPMAMPAAPKSASPLRAAAAVVAAPVALVGAGAELIAEAARKRQEREPEAILEEGSTSVAVQLRSDFSSEAAWIPNAKFTRGAALTLPVKLPDTLTTWRASALLLSLAHDYLLEADARVRTEKPLMVRLQAPRFFQERDELALRAMVDTRTPQTLSVRTTLQARGFALPEGATSLQTLPPNGQARVDVEFTVPPSNASEIVLTAEAVATNAEDTSDAEQRTIPYRPYGVLLRKTISGVIEEESTKANFELPADRNKEFTKLLVQIDRGPMDAVLSALDYLREYPYGCVEQTCSRLLPHLVWERLGTRDDGEASAYRSVRGKLTEEVVEETLRRITSMQNSDGGFGWWPGGSSDLWMTAYVVYTFSMAKQPDSQSLQNARKYLNQRLLKRDHSDDADVFAAFALVWTGDVVSDRVVEVLLSRWEGLSLTEKAKFCWVLAARGHKQATACGEEVAKALVGPAKRFLKKVLRDKEDELQWFHPGTTEAIAFFVLALLRQRSANGKQKYLSSDDETLEVLVSFLLQHRRGTRWHNTRDTALAVFALLTYEESMRSMGHDRQVDVRLNAVTKRSAKLERLGHEPISMQFRDEELQSGNNELSFVLDEAPSGSPVVFRHFSAELEYYTQESEIEAYGEGIEIDRSYWLLDEKKERTRQLRHGDTIKVGQRVRVVLKVKATKPRTYLLLEDRKLAGCEPVAKKSGREVCTGHCAHVELRADRTAIFFDSLGTDRHEVSYDIEAVLPGRFSAMPARIETMYEAFCHATSASFSLRVQ